ncbi:MAG: RNA polymerase sigma factor [Peptococcaceae bacterium]|nr:RNA polymerase sigma factor [Peptococcaceae bacterium]
MERDLLKNLYCRYARELYLYLYSLCRSHAMAEDLLQEVFLKALLSLSESHGNMRAWLYLVARNLCLNQMKRPGGAMMKKKEPPRSARNS